MPSDPPKEPLVKIRGLKTVLGGHMVHKNVNLDIYAGESFVLLGPSGTGKSVLLKEIIGLLRPTAGEIWFDGKEISHFSEREYLGIRRQASMLFQGAALFDSFSVFDNVAFPLREQGLAKEEDLPKIVAEKLSLVGLPGIEKKMPAELSGGMKKRVALARAIATEPRMILYDEPSTGLDPTNTRRINELIRSLQKKIGVTSLIVTHELSTVFEATDRAALLWEGEIVAVGPPEELRVSGPLLVRQFLEGTAPL
ncbi:MAG: ABC transporter ATP-binding protein [Bdellovibrionota bacterium]